MDWSNLYEQSFLGGLRSRSDIDISNLEEEKSYIVGTIRGYHSDKYLKQKGFFTLKSLHLSVNYKHMWGMSFGQRIDFILTNFVAIDTEMKSLGLSKKDIKTVVELHDFAGDLHIAKGLKTSSKTVVVFLWRYNRLKQMVPIKNYGKVGFINNVN
jgi:polar amino acid transport system substrate-binding protein